MQVLSQAEKQARKENCYSFYPIYSECQQNEPTSTQVHPSANKVSEESPETNFLLCELASTELKSDQSLSSYIFQRYLKLYIGQNLTDGFK